MENPQKIELAQKRKQVIFAESQEVYRGAKKQQIFLNSRKVF